MVQPEKDLSQRYVMLSDSVRGVRAAEIWIEAVAAGAGGLHRERGGKWARKGGRGARPAARFSPTWQAS
jgi:hypothetical protein